MFEPARSVKVIVATMALHNLCERNGVPIPQEGAGDDRGNDGLDDLPFPPVRPGDAQDGVDARQRVIRRHFERRCERNLSL